MHFSPRYSRCQARLAQEARQAMAATAPDPTPARPQTPAWPMPARRP